MEVSTALRVLGCFQINVAITNHSVLTMPLSRPAVKRMAEREQRPPRTRKRKPRSASFTTRLWTSFRLPDPPAKMRPVTRRSASGGATTCWGQFSDMTRR